MYFITVSCAVKTQLKGKNSNLTYKFQILVTGGINDNKFIKMYQMLIFLITDTITTAIYKIKKGKCKINSPNVLIIIQQKSAQNIDS